MPLTDVAIRNSKPAAKSFKLYDTGGLYLEISPCRRRMVAPEISLQRQGKPDMTWAVGAAEGRDGVIVGVGDAATFVFWNGETFW
jgi:hypothetical protein